MQTMALRFTRCVFGVTCSPFHLLATLNCHFDKYERSNPILTSELRHAMYVDDLTSGADDVMSCVELAKSARQILQEGLT